MTTTTRPTTIIRIPRSLVALRDVCTSKPGRYALDCVHVERRAGVARATVHVAGGPDFVALDFTGPDALATGMAVRGDFSEGKRLYFPALADAMARAAGTRDGDDAPLPVTLGIMDAHSAMRVVLANPGTRPVRLEAVLMPITLESGS